MYFYFERDPEVMDNFIREKGIIATKVRYGEYVLVDYKNGGNLPDDMRIQDDKKGIYICRCLSPLIDIERYDSGPVQPLYNLTTREAARTRKAIYIQRSAHLKIKSEGAVEGLGTNSGAIAYQNIFAYDDASVKRLIDAAEKKEGGTI